MACTVLHYDPMWTLSLPVGAVALGVGDLVSYESAAAVLMDAVTESATFVGVSNGKVAAGSTGTYIPIFPRCIVEISLSSSTYNLGEALIYASKNTLATATAGENAIGWLYQPDTGTVTSGKVLFDVPALAPTAAGTAAAFLFEAVTGDDT